MIELVGVVIPAKDEQELIGRCVVAVLAAARAVAPIPVQTIVVTDRCSDQTAEIARGHGVEVVPSLGTGVGAARRTGVELLARRATARGVRHDRVWVATTDADSAVPSHWLTAHLTEAARGGRLVVGRVAPDPRDLDPVLLAAWHERHPPTGGQHVHGANLAFRLDCYQVAGGFPDLALHEDQVLVSRLRSAGVPISPGPEVLTSARRWGRVDGGFASYLRALEMSIR